MSEIHRPILNAKEKESRELWEKQIKLKREKQEKEEVKRERSKAIEKLRALPPLKKEDVLKLIKEVGSPDKLNLGFRRFSGNFEKINLRGAKLYNTNLANTKFDEANLEKTDFSYADLIGVNFKKANMQYANLTGANLSFYGARNDYKHHLLNGVGNTITILRLADLRGANLEEALLFGVDLKGADLEGANLKGVKMGYIREYSYPGDDSNSLGSSNSIYTDLRNAKVTWDQLHNATICWGTILPNGKIYRGDKPRGSWPIFSSRHDYPFKE